MRKKTWERKEIVTILKRKQERKGVVREGE